MSSRDATRKEIASLTAVATSAKTTEPEVRTLRALDLAREPEPVPWIVPDWLAVGDYHALAGLGKVGKSLVALHTGLVLASGVGPWLGRVAVQGGPRRVLYVDEEQGDSLVLRRLHKLARGLGMTPEAVHDLPLRYLLRNGLNLEHEGDLQSLWRVVEDFCPDLVILDTLVRLHRSNENEAGPMRDLYAAAIRPLLDHYQCTVLGNTHMNKPSRDGKHGSLDLNRVRGSGELVNAADSIWAMQRREAGSVDLHLLGGRHGDADPLTVIFEDTEDGGLLVRALPLAPADGERKLPRAADKVLAFLIGRGDAVPMHVIASQTNLHRNTVSAHLRETLAPRGLVEPVGDEQFPPWRAVHSMHSSAVVQK